MEGRNERKLRESESESALFAKTRNWTPVGLRSRYFAQKKEGKRGKKGKRRDESAILPPFCPSVLEPGLHLCVRHLQGLGQGGSLGRRQVLLPVEALLQLADLHAAEGGARLFPLGRRPVLVGVSDSAGHGERREGSCRRQGREIKCREERNELVRR